MSDIIIVGAGISGLTAAINLSRNGHGVTVLERESLIGGMPDFRPDPAGSPFDLESIRNYAGVDIAPAVKPIETGSFWVWGRCFRFDLDPAVGMYMLERGSRPSSLDSLLLEAARKAGAKVEYVRPILTQGDFAALPPDTIVATGLQIEPYEALNIPHSLMFGYYARGAVDHDRTTVSLFMDDFSRDYAFTCTINGLSFALLFQRGAPLSREGKENFKRLIYDGEGLEFDGWRELMGGVCPDTLRTPRLFTGNKILAGTIAGVIDPFLYFGMLGALVSGRIAALAVEDKELAWRDFKTATLMYYPNFVARKLWDASPTPVKKFLLGHTLSTAERAKRQSAGPLPRVIPGWNLAARSRGAAGLRGNRDV